jgi:hypothetical protein
MLFSPAVARNKGGDTETRQNLPPVFAVAGHTAGTPLSSWRVCWRQHTRHKHLGAAEVAEFHDVAVWIQQQVLRLDVPVTHTSLVDVGQRSRYLVHVELGEHGRDQAGRPAATPDKRQSSAHRGEKLRDRLGATSRARLQSRWQGGTYSGV